MQRLQLDPNSGQFCGCALISNIYYHVKINSHEYVFLTLPTSHATAV